MRMKRQPLPPPRRVLTAMAEICLTTRPYYVDIGLFIAYDRLMRERNVRTESKGEAHSEFQHQPQRCLWATWTSWRQLGHLFLFAVDATKRAVIPPRQLHGHATLSQDCYKIPGTFPSLALHCDRILLTRSGACSDISATTQFHAASPPALDMSLL